MIPNAYTQLIRTGIRVQPILYRFNLKNYSEPSFAHYYSDEKTVIYSISTKG